MASAQMPLTSVPSAMAWAMSASVMMPAGVSVTEGLPCPPPDLPDGDHVVLGGRRVVGQAAGRVPVAGVLAGAGVAGPRRLVRLRRCAGSGAPGG